MAIKRAELGSNPTRYSDDPTRRLAIPPKPLKRATISGIAVIFTLVAAKNPISDPIQTPIKIKEKSIML